MHVSACRARPFWLAVYRSPDQVIDAQIEAILHKIALKIQNLMSCGHVLGCLDLEAGAF